jgi:glyoxylase-like metal-dependent hydrolase (beta-lactamase superfamily II)
MHWQSVAELVWIFQDSCNVYAVAGPKGIAVVNAGTGAWLEHLGELSGPVQAVVRTHYFRDHSAGAAEAARRGIPVHAPYWEQEQFADPLGLFQRREAYVIYDNVWDLFSPIEPIPVAGWLMEWDTARLAGMEFRILPTPGVTTGAISLLCDIGGRTLAFYGEATHCPGRLAGLAPLQYNYNDLGSAVNVIRTCRVLREARPHSLLPSLGQPMFEDTDDALAKLEESMRFALARRPEMKDYLAALDGEELKKVTDHVWCSAGKECCHVRVPEPA